MTETSISKEKPTLIEQLPSRIEKILAFRLSGKLHDADYQHFVPVIEAAVAKLGKIRLLAQFHDFHGWDLHALWDDIKLSAKLCHDIDRIALAGEKTWQEWMVKLCKPFTAARVRYFDAAQLDAAQAWLEA
jgi:hypothetical protein